MIVCGWCHGETEPGVCANCGRDPAIPWVQRAEQPPTWQAWQHATRRHRLAEARRQLGPQATVEQIAEHLSVSPRTVRRWQEMAAPRPVMPPRSG